MTPTEEIKKIQEALGMSSKVASEAVDLSYSAFRAYSQKNDMFKDYHAERLIEFVIKQTEKIKNRDYESR